MRHLKYRNRLKELTRYIKELTRHTIVPIFCVVSFVELCFRASFSFSLSHFLLYRVLFHYCKDMIKTHLVLFSIRFAFCRMFLPLTFFALLCSSDSYKVLVYNPRFGHSHSNYMGRLADIIAGAGHDVVRSFYSEYLIIIIVSCKINHYNILNFHRQVWSRSLIPLMLMERSILLR